MAKRKTFEETATRIQEISAMVAGRTMPLVKAIEDVDKEIHAIFHALLAKGRLSKAARRDVETIYEGMQEDGVITPDPRQAAEVDPFFDGMFDGEEPGAEIPFDRPAASEDDLGSAERPGVGEEGRTLRSLFRKLALAIHPDKAHGSADHARRAEAMKEVTQAYQNRDLARLLELEAAWLTDGDFPASNDEAELARRCQQVVMEIQQLTEQLKDIALDLRELRASPPAVITKGLWRVETIVKNRGPGIPMNAAPSCSRCSILFALIQTSDRAGRDRRLALLLDRPQGQGQEAMKHLGADGKIMRFITSDHVNLVGRTNSGILFH